MIYTNPPSPSSNQSTIPQRATPPTQPTPPVSEKEKKPEKKLETPVIVAIISAVVTLTTAILGSPVLLALVNKPATPASAPATQIVSAQNSPLSNNLSGVQIFQATFTPGESSSVTIELTSTLPANNPTSAPILLEPTFTVTPIELPNPTSPPPAAVSFFQCLAADLWNPYPSTLNPGISGGCWKLVDWGFSTDQDRLILAHTPSQDQERGISMPIAGDVDIRFTVQLDQFHTHFNKIGFLNFGIVQNEPLSIYTGGFLSYQQPAPGPASPVRVLLSGSHQATQRISDLESGFQHEVLFSIQDDLMRVYLNGELTGKPVKVPATERAFWIGYVLPSKTELGVTISNFTIQTR